MVVTLDETMTGDSKSVRGSFSDGKWGTNVFIFETNGFLTKIVVPIGVLSTSTPHPEHFRLEGRINQLHQQCHGQVIQSPYRPEFGPKPHLTSQ